MDFCLPLIRSWRNSEQELHGLNMPVPSSQPEGECPVLLCNRTALRSPLQEQFDDIRVSHGRCQHERGKALLHREIKLQIGVPESFQKIARGWLRKDGIHINPAIEKLSSKFCICCSHRAEQGGGEIWRRGRSRFRIAFRG